MVVKNPLIRPVISWGGGIWGGPLILVWLFNKYTKKNFSRDTSGFFLGGYWRVFGTHGFARK